MKSSNRNSDVLITGGGLAGLTLAIQIRHSCPQMAVTVLEKNRYPVPIAAHKVGESTVEIAAHYFAKTLGLEKHLEDQQLPKFGLRYFFGGPSPPADMALYDELGTSDFLPVRTYQLDRGIFENHLARVARELGVTLHEGMSVKTVSVNNRKGGHTVTARSDTGEVSLSARWLIDSMGRHSLLKKRLELHKSTPHANCAVWLRTSETLDIDDFGTGEHWRTRCGTNRRMLSTNHLMGTGYWFWLIPLASGSTSLGLVFDPSIHPVRNVNNFNRLVNWLAVHHPVWADVLEQKKHTVLDFHTLRNYAHSSRNVYSADRWALSGEAGLFTDPFYSPGSDLIAINNTVITELILRESRGEDIEFSTRFFEQLYFSVFRNSLNTVRKQYPGFGDRELMTVKTTWDYAYYWATLAYLFFSDNLTNIGFLKSANADLQAASELNQYMQDIFQSVARQRRSMPAQGRFIDHCAVPFLPELKKQLLGSGPDDALTVLRNNVNWLMGLSTVVKNLVETGLDNADLINYAEVESLTDRTSLRRAAGK
jgi:flavin-dependent dehydrogenase